MDNLPDISRLKALPSTVWEELGERLRSAGFDGQYLEGSSQGGMKSYVVSLQQPILTWRVRRRNDLQAYAFRLFMLRDPISDSHAVEVLGHSLLDDLVAAGLLIRPQPGLAVSVFDLRIFRGLLILCDDLSHRGDAVFGAGPGTAAFCSPSAERGIVAQAVDLGCGAGAAALWLCGHAHRVTATDINPRALAFVKINAAMNRINNVEVRQGDLFDPIEGEAFDFIVSQPPCIPRASGLHPATYLFGGPRGTELVHHIISELPKYLREDGRAMVVHDQPLMEAANGDQMEAANGDQQDWQPKHNQDMRMLLLIGAEVDADAYSIRHSAPELRRGIDAFDKTATSMRGHLSQVGIRGLCPAICVLEHAAGSRGWIEIVRTNNTLWDQISTEIIDRLLAGYQFLSQGTGAIQTSGIHIPDGSLLVRPAHTNGTPGGKVYLGLPRGYLFDSLELTQEQWEVLQAIDRGGAQQPTPELIAKVVRAGLLHDSGS